MGPGQQEANLQLATMSGLSLEIVEQLQEIYNSDKSVEEKMTESEEVLKKSLPVEKQSLNAMKDGFAGVKKHLNTIEAMNIALGAKIAPDMMKLQKAQLGLVMDLAKYFPQMIKLLTDIFHILRTTLAWLMKDPMLDAVKGVDKAIEEQIKHLKEKKAGAPEEEIKKTEALKQAEAALIETGKAGRMLKVARAVQRNPWTALKTIISGTPEQRAAVAALQPTPEQTAAQKARAKQGGGVMARAAKALREMGVPEGTAIGEPAMRALRGAKTPEQQQAAIKQAITAGQKQAARDKRKAEAAETARQAQLTKLYGGFWAEAAPPGGATEVRKPSAGPKARRIGHTGRGGTATTSNR
jgi:hypothetical protein